MVQTRLTRLIQSEKTLRLAGGEKFSSDRVAETEQSVDDSTNVSASVKASDTNSRRDAPSIDDEDDS